jgi:type 1 glutamine amidotransferase
MRAGAVKRAVAATLMRMNTKALVLCDDFWHPAKTPRAGLMQLAGEQAGMAFDWMESAHDWPALKIKDYPLIILTKSNNVSSQDKTHWMTDEVQRSLLDFVQGGGGLLAIHSGTAEYKEAPVLRALLGGVFDMHPPQCMVTVEPTLPNALTAGVEPFTLKDEHYFMLMESAPAEVFLRARSEHGEQPAGWQRTAGKGRVVVLTPGHNVEVWLHPGFQTLLRNAAKACASERLSWL